MIGLIGLSHQTALVEIREQLVISPDTVTDLFNFLKTKSSITGLFALTTCNRTELYFETNQTTISEVEILEQAKSELLSYYSTSDDVRKYLFSYSGIEVTQHLFLVATGLDSMVLGEYQIVSQLKEAYQHMNKLNLLGPILKRMVQKAFETGKVVRSQTAINKGFVSVSSAAVYMTGKRLGNFENIKALTVGAGETGTIVVQNLIKKQCSNITIANRTLKKAQNLANKTNCHAISLDAISAQLETVDIALYTTGSKEFLLTKERLDPIMRNRNYKPLLIIDLCIPRNVDHKVGELNGVSLIDLDQLEEMVNANFEMRKGEKSKAEKIIDTAVNDFENWLGVRRLKEAINSITSSFKEVNNTEAKNYHKVKSNEEVQQHINNFGDHLSSKYSRMFIKQLREITNEGRDPEKVKIVSELFNFNSKS